MPKAYERNNGDCLFAATAIGRLVEKVRKQACSANCTPATPATTTAEPKSPAEPAALCSCLQDRAAQLDTLAALLRDATCAWNSKHRAIFDEGWQSHRAAATDDSPSHALGRDPSQHINMMRRAGVFGGDLELQGLTNHIKREIMVLALTEKAGTLSYKRSPINASTRQTARKYPTVMLAYFPETPGASGHYAPLCRETEHHLTAPHEPTPRAGATPLRTAPPSTATAGPRTRFRGRTTNTITDAGSSATASSSPDDE